MSISALHSAATGMAAMDTRLDVIANNLANANTTGFKASRVNFEDLFYETRRQPGALNNLGERTSTGLQVGLGVRVSNTQLDLQNGSLLQTGKPLDLAIQGQGFFRVKTFEGIGEGEAFTRAGNFIINDEGQMLLATTDGPILDPEISFPPNVDLNSVTIQSDGRITGQVDGQLEELGTIELHKFPNPYGLKQVGGNLLIETEASGAPITGEPGDPGFGTLAQRFLEASNVDPVEELIGMIRTQRTFEMNSQTIRAADENLQVVSRLRR